MNTAISVPKCKRRSKATMSSPDSRPKIILNIARCPELEMGKNSVIP